uniref:Uncharacterized protein n=1 Tax=Anopheles coluzzii TaxID=1518534 RepID=A0A8W7PI69_ANOCL
MSGDISRSRSGGMTFGPWLLIRAHAAPPRMPLISASSSSNLASFMLTCCRKSSSNLNAPPPVAQTVVTSWAMPFDLASFRKLSISDVGKRMKWSEPRRPRITTSSICRWLSRWPVLP